MVIKIIKHQNTLQIQTLNLSYFLHRIKSTQPWVMVSFIPGLKILYLAVSYYFKDVEFEVKKGLFLRSISLVLEVVT